jgi:hypothetical protein
MNAFLISFVNNRPVHFSRLRIFIAHFCHKFRYKTRLQRNRNSQEICMFHWCHLDNVLHHLDQFFPHSDCDSIMKYILLLLVSHNKPNFVLHTHVCDIHTYVPVTIICVHIFIHTSLWNALENTTIINILVCISNKCQPIEKIMTSKLKYKI